MNKTNLPTIYNYGNYSSENYGAHCMALEIPRSRKDKHGITLYFSYSTLVAFRGYVNEKQYGLFVCKNIWGTTTGKHLNFIDGGAKTSRLDSDTFEKLYQKALRNA